MKDFLMFIGLILISIVMFIVSIIAYILEIIIFFFVGTALIIKGIINDDK